MVRWDPHKILSRVTVEITVQRAYRTGQCILVEFWLIGPSSVQLISRADLTMFSKHLKSNAGARNFIECRRDFNLNPKLIYETSLKVYRLAFQTTMTEASNLGQV